MTSSSQRDLSAQTAQTSEAPPLLAAYARQLHERPGWRWQGRVTEANSQWIESDGPFCALGECCEIADESGRRYPGEVIGIRGTRVLSMTLERATGIHLGNAVTALGTRPAIAVGTQLQGRVLDAMGRAMDGGPPPRVTESWALDSDAPAAMERRPITRPLRTGIRAIDGMLTTGRGQRVGIFGGSGVGKSMLVGMMTRNTSADLTVVGLVGERGREVREFLEDVLGEEGRRRSVVVVSTSDQSPLLRIRAALTATSVAEYFAAQGKHVLLVLDSLTRFAMAEREVGLAAGEPPTVRGYTPSVFAKLARLVERAGNFETGSITAFYSVLMEGDDQQDPLVDAVRSLLDGHVLLSRALTSEGHFPPIAVLDSVSRLMNTVAQPAHRNAARDIRRLMAAYARSEDLVRIGAYRAGADRELDAALALNPRIRAWLQQGPQDSPSMAECVAQLQALLAPGATPSAALHKP